MLRKNLALACSFSCLLACSEGPLGEASSPIIGGQPTTGDGAVMMLVSYPNDISTLDS